MSDLPEYLFLTEPLDAFIDEAMPLLEQHYRELSSNQDIPLEVNFDVYRAMEESGTLALFTARRHKRPGWTGTAPLVGYAAFLLSKNPHYNSSLQALQDVLYIAPCYRGGGLGLQLIKYAEHELRQRGVQLVYHHQKLAHPALGKLLEKLDYQPVEQIWSKRLDR